SDLSYKDSMTNPYRLLAPGPVQIPKFARDILAEPMVHHRTPLFTDCLKRVFLKLKQVFKTKQEVFILSSTGSGAMEAAISNTLAPNDKALVIDAGKFGERWVKMAKTYELDTHVIKIEWGQSVEPKQIEAFLLQ